MEHNLDYKTKPNYNSYKRGAIGRNIGFLLTKEEFTEISKQKCTYCGKDGPNGIDRKNSEHGYSFQNCQACCKHCNYSKGNLSEELFNSWIKRLMDYQSNN